MTRADESLSQLSIKTRIETVFSGSPPVEGFSLSQLSIKTRIETVIRISPHAPPHSFESAIH